MTSVPRNGKCENTLGSFKCLCDDGYSIKEELEDGCTDDDECELNLYHCDPRAECQNTNGSYVCSCHEGFSGDGFECQVLERDLPKTYGFTPVSEHVDVAGGGHLLAS
jgi:Calcium binding EGF domain.